MMGLMVNNLLNGKQPFTDDDLSVIHISADGKVKLLQPVEVTNTHVVVNVTHLSLFGLVYKKLFKPKAKKPVFSQLLLFLRPPSKRRELKVCLVPGNVSIDGVNYALLSNNHQRHAIYLNFQKVWPKRPNST